MPIKIAIAVGTIIVLGGGSWWLASRDDGRAGPSQTNTSGAAENSNGATAVASCPFPIIEVPEQAVSYGVPAGWIVERDGGTLAIMEDDRNLTAAFIYTAKLEQDLSAEAFLQEFGGVFKAAVEDAGGTFILETPTVAGETARAVAKATVAEGELQGIFETLKEPGFITFRAYWAPLADLAVKEPTLQQVVDCFARSTSLTDAQLIAAAAAKQVTNTSQFSSPWGALVAGSDGAFNFQAPSSWTANASTAGESSGLTLDAPGSDASVAFLFNLGRYGAADPAEFAQTTMSVTYGIQATLSNHQTVDGAETYDFTGTFQGKAVRGAVAVRIEAYQTFFAHYLGVMIANADRWGAYAPTLNTIQSTIRLADAGQQLKSLPALPNYSTEELFGSSVTSGQKYQDEVEDRSSQKWADAMRGYETVESPTTGDRYDAPLNSWNPTGPDGGGYYRQLPGGGLEQLQPVE